MRFCAPACLRRLPRDERGATLVEFALIAPVFVLLLMGGFDLAYQQYAKTVLEGEVAKAGRDSALETGGGASMQTTIDDRLSASIHAVAPDGRVSFARRSYSSYDRVASPGEPYIDADHDGICNHGEAYQDSNRNGSFDATNGSASGFGGAKDVLLYTVTLTYPRLFPTAALLGWSNEVTMSASTVLRIQPFTTRAAVPTLTCT